MQRKTGSLSTPQRPHDSIEDMWRETPISLIDDRKCLEDWETGDAQGSAEGPIIERDIRVSRHTWNDRRPSPACKRVESVETGTLATDY